MFFLTIQTHKVKKICNEEEKKPYQNHKIEYEEKNIAEADQRNNENG